MTSPSHSQALDGPRKKAEGLGLQRHTPTSPDEASLDLGAVWETLRRNKWLIFLTCVLVTGAVGAYTWSLPKTFEANSIVSVETPANGRAALLGIGSVPKLDTEIGLLQNSGELSRRVLARVRAAADTTGGDAFPVLGPDDTGQPVDDLVLTERLRRQTTFRAAGGQGLITITARSESPREAAVVANVFAEEYRIFSQEIAREGVVAARQFLVDQLEKRKNDIQQIEGDWEAFARNNAVATEGQDGQQVAREYVELQTQRDALVFELEQEKRQLAILESQIEKRQPNLRDNVFSEQKVQALRTQIQALENQIATLKTDAEQYYINDPSLRGNEDQLPELAEITRRMNGFEARKAALTEDLVDATREAGLTIGDGTTTLAQMGTQRDLAQAQELKVGQLEAQLDGLDNRIARYQSRITDIPRQTVEREQLDRRLAQAETFYTDIAGELQKTIIAEESELGYVKIMRTAFVPMMPVSPDLRQNMLLGILLGLGLGVGGAFVKQSMNWQIYEPDDLQEQGYSLVGVIPKMDRELKKTFKGETRIDVDGRSLSTSLFPLINPWSPITENYRLIRANLRFNGIGKTDGATGGQTLLVTSPEPGDGKTTTAVNLAITLTLSGHEVLLIDADMRRPNAHKLLGMSRGPGVAEVLSGTQVASDVLQDTVVDGLSFLSAGTASVPPTELLDTDRLRALLAASTQRFDVVIVDTPPVLAATDPVVVAPHCDAVLVVASADQTDFRSLAQVSETLAAVGGSIDGVIFNRYNPSKAGGTYGYGYDNKYEYTPTSD